MKILVVAATLPEIDEIFRHFNLTPATFVKTPKFDLLVTGVGMTATAFALGKYLSNDYHLVLNLGIAGCFDPSINLGAVLNIIADEFAELGAEDKEMFLPIDVLGLGKSKFKSNYTSSLKVLTELPVVNGITVNKVHGNTKHIMDIKERLHPVTESMEGAAIFYACEQANLPAVQVRSISNYVEERNRAAWNIALALKNLNIWAIEFLTHA